MKDGRVDPATALLVVVGDGARCRDIYHLVMEGSLGSVGCGLDSERSTDRHETDRIDQLHIQHLYVRQILKSP